MEKNDREVFQHYGLGKRAGLSAPDAPAGLEVCPRFGAGAVSFCEVRAGGRGLSDLSLIHI